MKKLMILAAIAALLSGCARDEAEKFGYRGSDLGNDEQTFFTVGLVTNWVPMRVITVYEKYDMSADESNLVAAAGIIVPSSSFQTVPEGYEKSVVEPWFVNWTNQTTGFGRQGTAGFISHFDEDAKVWKTGETYFSSYYPTEAEALAALAALRKEIAEKYNPKRFHDFDKAWVAEYLRLRVMGVVGQKADGTWSCMLDIQDKNLSGCGAWEPPAEQQERVAEYAYRKALAAWRIEKAKASEANHAAVEKLRKEKDLELFGADNPGFEGDDGRRVYMRSGDDDAAGKDIASAWNEKRAALETATGVKFPDAFEEQESDSGFVIRSASATNGMYEIRLDLAFPKEPQAESKWEWRELCFEQLQPGTVIPPRPQSVQK